MKIDISDYTTIGLVAFAMSVVRGVVDPHRRGLPGFVGGIVVGVCCAGVTCVLAAEFGIPWRWQLVGATVSGIMGDRLVGAVLLVTGNRQTINISGGQNVVGKNEGGINEQ